MCAKRVLLDELEPELQFHVFRANVEKHEIDSCGEFRYSGVEVDSSAELALVVRNYVPHNETFLLTAHRNKLSLFLF